MSLLEIENLSLDIGGTPILKDIELSIEAGEVMGLVGESGSGKSMTALSVMRLLPEGRADIGPHRFQRHRYIGCLRSTRCARFVATTSAWSSRSR